LALREQKLDCKPLSVVDPEAEDVIPLSLGLVQARR
jgi:hypothetical protein